MVLTMSINILYLSYTTTGKRKEIRSNAQLSIQIPILKAKSLAAQLSLHGISNRDIQGSNPHFPNSRII